jgi:SAM-dependent methyltransferase
MVVPSTLFDCGDQHIRVGLGRATFPTVLQHVERHLADAQGQRCEFGQHWVSETALHRVSVTQRSFRTDYDEYAQTYAWARTAVPWIVQPLERVTRGLPVDAKVLEIGCGTGNYVCALAGFRRDLTCTGLDLSAPMLKEARARQSNVSFVRGDAAGEFPFPDRIFGLAFAVDVIHHLENIPNFFREVHRVLVAGGSLIIVTDSENTLRRRSLTKFFPEILPLELIRYPGVPRLHQEAARVGLLLRSEEEVAGEIILDREFLARLEAKCSSAMRLITPAEHSAGMARVRAGRERRETWLSCYDVLHYVRRL